MSSFIDRLAKQRSKFSEGLDANEGDINLDIFEDFYPDQAHFLFELLQNAEDAEASRATFTLLRDGCRFVHNGKREFTETDVRAITGIHNSTKSKGPDQIGKFGVGFKSVFVYTISPTIQSGEFSFGISRLVLPDPVEPDSDLGDDTSFWLPFNSPKKAPDAAYAEIEAGLRELAETTLLFLTHLESIRWQIGQESSGDVVRIKHSTYHFEVLRKANGGTTSSHFLKFDQPVEGLGKQRVAVAFELDFLPDTRAVHPNEPLAKQMKVIPAARPHVAVSFPAAKEVSGLRFHLHAPFVPELSRASIKETPANRPLFVQLATLTASSLYEIRDLGLLTVDFLAVLPNPQDDIGDRYEVIREAIIEEMNTAPLTPTNSKSHGPARSLVQARASLKDLLSAKDLEFLVDNCGEPPKWAVAASQKNSDADRFLAGLDIRRWDVHDFVGLLCHKLSDLSPIGLPGRSSAPELIDWLRSKSAAWHQELYALLLKENLEPAGFSKTQLASRLKSHRIVRLAGGDYARGSESFFATAGSESDKVLPRVDPAVYTTGKSKAQREHARTLLEEIGVREVGQAEVVEVILKRRYRREPTVSEKTYGNDLKRFVDLVEKQPETARLFADYFIFDCGDSWRKPRQVFVDNPFLDTGLSAYYGALGADADRFPLVDRCQSCGINAKRLADFAIAVGAAGALEIKPASCHDNPDARKLAWRAPGNWSRSYGVNRDHQIPKLDQLLQSPTPALSRLVWRTLCQQEDDSWTRAEYRCNSDHPIETTDSVLVGILRGRAWVPQTDDGFVRPAAATRERFPAGLPFDPGWPWLKAIGFGEESAKEFESELQRQWLACELGFDDSEGLERAKRFAAIPVDEQRRFLAEWDCRAAFELPDHESVNSVRRAERIANEAKNPPGRRSAERTRSVSVGLEAVKEQARQYLRQQYTNGEGQMICQACRCQLPFRLDSGLDYFEAVELVDLKGRHFRNYLALCPNHAAMFEHANGSADELRDIVVGLGGNEATVVLAKEDSKIYFTKMHLADIKQTIRIDESERERTAEEAKRLD